MFREFLAYVGSLWNVSCVCCIGNSWSSFWHVSVVYGRFRELLAFSWSFWNVSLTCFCSFLNVSGVSRMFRRFPELNPCSGSFLKNPSGVSGMPREYLECFGPYWDVSGVSGMFLLFLGRFGSFWIVSGVSGRFR